VAARSIAADYGTRWLPHCVGYAATSKVGD
jgi:hypothetical protein